MRFTKIPLIATLMAVALSLLIVLPALAQVSGDRTNGRDAVGAGNWLDVRVADNVDDLDNNPDQGADASPTNVGHNQNAYATGNDAFDARDTFFNDTLYISNKEGAYNTVLITARVSESANLATTGPTGNLDDSATGIDTSTDPPTLNDESMGDCAGTGVAVATIKNLRNNDSATAYLYESSETDGTTANVRIYQGIAAVWDQDQDVEKHDGPCAISTQEEPDLGQKDPVRYDRTNNTFGEDSLTTLVAPEDGWDPSSAAVIPARDGDTIQITVKGVQGSVTLVVDGDAPTIEDLDPANKGLQDSTTVSLAFSVSDDGAGLRYDGESGAASTDQDLAPANGDGDQRFDEPITVAADPNATPQVVADGSTQDIAVNFTGELDTTYKVACVQNCDDNDPTTDVLDSTLETDKAYLPSKADAEWGTATEESSNGTNSWTQISKGVEYKLSMKLTGNDFGKYYWQVSATDRVGNKAVTDSDDENDGKQAYSFNVDDAKPMVAEARTGVGYKDGKGEFADRSWIALSFVNDNDGATPDRIASGTVDASDFTVEGNSVASALVPSDSKVCEDPDPKKKNINSLDKGCDFDPRTRVYLQLAQALDSDETPTIQLLGGVLKDIAGNSNKTQSLEKEVMDKIAPGVAITVTSSSGATGRPAADSKGSFKVRVESDEDLKTFPSLYFGTIQGTAVIDGDKVGTASDLKAGAVSGAFSLSEKADNVWETTVKVSALPGSNNRILALIVTATDAADGGGNSGNSAGWKVAGSAPAEDDELDFKKLDAGGFLVEVDSFLPTADIEVLPSSDPGKVTDKTESVNPYIQITFKEPNEYGIAVTDSDGDTDVAKKADIGDGKTASTDSHADVKINSLTLNGEDRLKDVVRVKAGEYVLALTGLEIGEYEIVYTAQDDVGNDAVDSKNVKEIKFEFEVEERQPYKVALQPGWNLVSVPGDPFNPAVGEVVGSSLRADTVLAYQGGEWVTSVRNEDGRWQGTLTEIRGGYGYWVRTTALESISTVIPPILPTDVLPTVPVISGWNLLGVVDAEQANAGTEEDADQYLVSLPSWRVAYGFDTRLNSWSKLLPGAADTVENGKGYWVWSSKPGTLVP